MRKCPECNYEVNESSQFCVNCGAEMPGYVQAKSGFANHDIKNPEYKKPKQSLLFIVLFFGTFFLAGCIAGYFIFIKPVYNIIQAKNWTETPCVIKSSEVKSHRGSKGGTTYSVYIIYTYKVNGVEYTSDRYKFMSSSSSGYDSKKQFIDQYYPPGRASICYIDPKNPENAVIERGFTSDLFLGLIMSLVFIGTGAIGMYAGLKPLLSKK